MAIVVGAGGELGLATAVKLSERSMTATLVNTIGAFQTGDATRILDLELRLLGIRVNCMAPQLLDTAFARTSFPKEVLAHAVSPAAVAEVAAFLVSDAAAPISGAVLPAYGF